MGATMSTVATLSTKALITPAKGLKPLQPIYIRYLGNKHLGKACGHFVVYKQGNDAHGAAYHKQNIIVNAKRASIGVKSYSPHSPRIINTAPPPKAI